MRIANEQERFESLIFRILDREIGQVWSGDVVISRKNEERKIMHRWPISERRRNMEKDRRDTLFRRITVE